MVWVSNKLILPEYPLHYKGQLEDNEGPSFRDSHRTSTETTQKEVKIYQGPRKEGANNEISFKRVSELTL